MLQTKKAEAIEILSEEYGVEILCEDPLEIVCDWDSEVHASGYMAEQLISSYMEDYDNREECFCPCCTDGRPEHCCGHLDDDDPATREAPCFINEHFFYIDYGWHCHDCRHHWKKKDYAFHKEHNNLDDYPESYDCDNCYGTGDNVLIVNIEDATFDDLELLWESAVDPKKHGALLFAYAMSLCQRLTTT
jgi:hypothetical protein